MTTDTDALVQTVREALTSWQMQTPTMQRANAQKARAALDSLAAELERRELPKFKADPVPWRDRALAAEDELERVKAERDEWKNEAESRMEMEQNAPEAEARLDKALTALREMDENGHEWFVNEDGSEGEHLEPCPGCLARAALAEIEGEAT